MKKIKYFLYKIKKDLQVVNKYPYFDESAARGDDYSEYWEKRRGKDYQAFLSDWQKDRADYFLPYVKENDVIVDIGGGDGKVLQYINNKIKIRGIVADFNVKVLAVAKKNGLDTININIKNISGLKELPDCDWIAGFEILEPIANPEEFLLNMNDHVRKGMIFSVPNSGYYLHRLRLLSGKFPLQWINHPGEHLRFWTAGDMKWWLQRLGFRAVEIKIYRGLPGLNKIFPKLFGQGILFKIEK